MKNNYGNLKSLLDVGHDWPSIMSLGFTVVAQALIDAERYDIVKEKSAPAGITGDALDAWADTQIKAALVAPA